MNNYANWELTQLLPEKNPYHTGLNHDFRFHWFKLTFHFIKNEDDEKPYLDSNQALYNHSFGEKYLYSRDAWTWEEIRLYLESKGYSISYKHNLFDDKVSWSVCVNNMTNKIYSTVEIEEDNYEQAREKAIKYCLNAQNSKD